MHRDENRMCRDMTMTEYLHEKDWVKEKGEVSVQYSAKRRVRKR